MSKKGLGRGLGALISENSTEKTDQLLKIDIDKIKPNKKQPRRKFDPSKLEELSNSIDQYGIIQPIVVRSVAAGYEIIAGERRWRAAKNLSLKKVPVVIKKANELTVSKLALIENIQREDLNEIEEATAYNHLIEEYDLTQKELSEIIGKSRSYIANLLRLLSLEDEIKQELIDGEISNGHARALLALKNPEERLLVLEKIIQLNFSVRKTENYIKKLKNSKNKIRKKVKKKDKEVIYYEDKLSEKYDTKVKINHKKNNKGKIEIEYYSLEDLNRIIEKL